MWVMSQTKPQNAWKLEMDNSVHPTILLCCSIFIFCFFFDDNIIDSVNNGPVFEYTYVGQTAL